VKFTEMELEDFRAFEDETIGFAEQTCFVGRIVHNCSTAV